MKAKIRIVVLFIIVGFIGIQLSVFVDDPDHLLRPDPQCPICVAAKTPVLLHPAPPASFTSDVVAYVPETPLPAPHSEIPACILSIRAPPHS
jgi:hypothetical protein